MNGKTNQIIDKRDRWNIVRKDKAAYEYLKTLWIRRRRFITNWITLHTLKHAFWCVEQKIRNIKT